MTDYDRHQRAMCQDCGHDTRLMGEMYMIDHDLWFAACRNGDGACMLCIACLEARIGRRLRPRDFIDCPLNFDWIAPQSLRLRSRLYHHGLATIHHLRQETA